MIINKLLAGTTVAAGLLVLLPACSDTFDPAIASEKRGRLLVSVGLDKDVAAPKAMSKAPASRTNADEIAVEDLTLRLVSEDGSYEENWDTADQMAEAGEVPVGTYQFEVFYGEPEDEGFEKPYYYGEQTVTIMENQTTTVEVTATLADAMVSVSYSDAVLSYFSDIDGKVKTSLQNEFKYEADEERPLYVAPGAVSVSVDVKKQNGVTATLTTDRIIAEARNHYHVNFDVNGGETGSPTLTVTFSSALDEKVVELDLSDEILSAPAPEIFATGFENGEKIMLVEHVAVENLAATIVGQAGLKSVVLTTNSTWLTGQGWPVTVDLANLDAETLALLTEFGLKLHGLDSSKSKMVLIDFGGVVEHVPYIDEMDNTTTFSLVATDRAGHSSGEPFTLAFEVENLALMVTEIAPLKQDDTQLGFDVLYNASGFEKNVKVQVRNIRNTWDTVKPLSVTQDSDNSHLYHVVVPVSGDDDVVFKVLAGKDESEECIAVRQSRPAEVNENDVFATHAAITFTGNDVISADGATVMLSSDGGQSYVTVPSAASGKKLNFAGLEPGKTYMVKASLDGLGSKPIRFTTEEALQIPNGNLDADIISHSNNQYEFIGWGTNNPMTSSQGASLEYCRNSGSIQTDDAVKGKAALLRTTGWGSGNTNAGALSIIKYVDPALLHLGAERSSRASDIYGTSDLDCGINFDSRPASLSFYYKYSAPNSGDTGEVLIRVIDKSGKTILEKKQDLGAKSSYGEETVVPLIYPDNAPKCGKLYVRFLSSNKTPGDKDKNWLKFGNPHTGAQLYVDEIKLNY